MNIKQAPQRKPLKLIISLMYVLGWPKSSFRFFHKMLQTSPNELFGQLNRSPETVEMFFKFVVQSTLIWNNGNRKYYIQRGLQICLIQLQIWKLWQSDLSKVISQVTVQPRTQRMILLPSRWMTFCLTITSPSSGNHLLYSELGSQGLPRA